MLAQLTPQSATAAAAIVTAAIAAAAAIIKKLLPRKEQPKPDHVTRTEFHQGLDKLTEKIENLSTSIHTRLARIEAGLARLDERTKF
jgi:hypothetical protein